ncbi:MAG: RsmD family RNA methyltransferase [Planctomycetes bacterium]|nr:RsmD family RNA methyltransferase [Planctomycetota bacterium]
MRIIAGQWRSRKLVRPESSGTRPMPDRIREAVFAALGSHFDCPGLLPPLIVADVFAGGGSMGLEALSRGAAECCFYERGREALAALQQNLDSLRVGASATVIARDAWSSAIDSPGGRSFGIVFLDPPYADTQDMRDGSRLARYLGRMAESDDNRPLVVLHHAKKSCVQDDALHPWRVIDQRTFGTSAVTMFMR